MNEFEQSYFKRADIETHNTILKSENRVLFDRLLLVFILVILFFAPGTWLVYQTNSFQQTNRQVDNESEEALLAGFTQTEESIITELYGDRTGYADKKTFHKKADFVDKEATRESGKITYDEEAYQAYYDSFLKEYDDMIDYDKVRATLEERKAAYLESQKAKAPASKTRMQLFMPTPQILLITGAFILMCAIYLGYTIKRYRCIVQMEYSVAEGDVVRKFNYAWTHQWLRHRVEINYGGGLQQALLTSRQTLGIQKGQKVYLIRLDSGYFWGKRRFAVCKKEWD